MQRDDFIHLRVHCLLSEGAIRIEDWRSCASSRRCRRWRSPQQPVRRHGILLDMRQVGVRPIIRLPARAGDAAVGVAARGGGRAYRRRAGRRSSSWCRTHTATPICCGCWRWPWCRVAVRSPRVARRSMRVRRWAHPPDRRSGRARRAAAAGGPARGGRNAGGPVAGGVRDRLYVEHCDTGLESEAATEPACWPSPHKAGLPIVATNDAASPHPMYDAARCCASTRAPGGHQPPPPDAGARLQERRDAGDVLRPPRRHRQHRADRPPLRRDRFGAADARLRLWRERDGGGAARRRLGVA